MENIIQAIHEKAVQCAKNYRKSESELLEILIEVDTKRVFEKLGYPSLFVYCTTALNLTEAQSYALIGVARKSRVIPELKTCIDQGKMHLSNARRIVSVITPENKDLWLGKAMSLPQRALEKEIVKAQPREMTKERVRPVAEDRLELRVGISEEIEEKLKRVKEVLSQKRQRPVPLEEALLVMAEEYLTRHDPVEKARRRVGVGKVSAIQGNGKRVPLSAPIKHAVNFRDGGQCAFTYSDGKRCAERQWLQTHHLHAVAQGGKNAIENLVTVCSAHHRFLHARRASL
jgi:5-methylcytosine-specific restriction endonuclease McrA